MEEEGSYERGLRPEDMVPDEEAQYYSEEENQEAKIKEKPVGPPLELEIPLRPPPSHPDKVFSWFLFLSASVVAFECIIYVVLYNFCIA